MSYDMAAALQTALYTEITSGPTAAVIGNIPCFDMPFAGNTATLFILLGPEKMRDTRDSSGACASFSVVVSVISKESGFHAAKTTAGQLTKALPQATLSLSVGTLIDLQFDRATARQIAKGTGRRIDLVFRARVDDFTPSI